jgi:hypothetical protein
MTATIRKIEQSKKVERVSDERRSGNGVWAYLAPGWHCILAGSHACHEDTIEELAKAVRFAERCKCSDCEARR